jgi:hypothetical protein
LGQVEQAGKGCSGHSELPHSKIAEDASGLDETRILAKEKNLIGLETVEAGNKRGEAVKIVTSDLPLIATLERFLAGFHDLCDEFHVAQDTLVSLDAPPFSVERKYSLIAPEEAATDEIRPPSCFDSCLNEATIAISGARRLFTEVVKHIGRIVPYTLVASHHAGVTRIRI